MEDRPIWGCGSDDALRILLEANRTRIPHCCKIANFTQNGPAGILSVSPVFATVDAKGYGKGSSFPTVDPVRYDRKDTGQFFQFGVYVKSSAPVYRVGIEPVSLAGEWVLRFDDVLNRLEGEGFLEAMACRGNHSQDLETAWQNMHTAIGLPGIFPFTITYQDSDGKEYISLCELHRDVLKPHGFDVKLIGRKRIRWWSRLSSPRLRRD